LGWAGHVNVQDSYSWDPVNIVDGLSESDILGVEAPLWTETIRTMDDLEYMAFPRLLSIAEIGWPPAEHSGRQFLPIAASALARRSIKSSGLTPYRG